MSTPYLGPGVESFLRKAGLLDLLEYIHEHAANTSHEEGNRRWHHLILDVKGDAILKVYDTATGERSKPEELAPNPDEFVAWDECPNCDEAGNNSCPVCRGRGGIRVVRKLKT